jgi:hypothetical protein
MPAAVIRPAELPLGAVSFTQPFLEFDEKAPVFWKRAVRLAPRAGTPDHPAPRARASAHATVAVEGPVCNNRALILCPRE